MLQIKCHLGMGCMDFRDDEVFASLTLMISILHKISRDVPKISRLRLIECLLSYMPKLVEAYS